MKKTAVFIVAAALVVSLAGVAGCAPGATEPKESTMKDGAQIAVNTDPLSNEVASNEEQHRANKHLTYSTQCEDCHIGESDPHAAPVTDEGCRNCHDYDAVVNATADLVDEKNRMPNPHDSHIGDVDCMLCHSNHTESTYYCLTCHPDSEYQEIAVP